VPLVCVFRGAPMYGRQFWRGDRAVKCLECCVRSHEMSFSFTWCSLAHLFECLGEWHSGRGVVLSPSPGYAGAPVVRRAWGESSAYAAVRLQPHWVRHLSARTACGRRSRGSSSSVLCVCVV